MLLALNQLGITGAEDLLQGTNAVVFSYKDEVTAPKILMDTIKKDKVLELRFGIVENKIVSKEEVETLAKLPSKEALLSQLLSILSAQPHLFVLNAPTQVL